MTGTTMSVEELVQGRITDAMLAHVTTRAAQVIACPPDNAREASHYSPSLLLIPPLSVFIRKVSQCDQVTVASFLSTLVLLERLRQKLPSAAKGLKCTCHRIFLATLIVTMKCLNDTAPRNKYWARCFPYFSLSEINLMERQLLCLLGYELIISQDDLEACLRPLLRLPTLTEAPSKPMTIPNGVPIKSLAPHTVQLPSISRVHTTPLPRPLSILQHFCRKSHEDLCPREYKHYTHADRLSFPPFPPQPPLLSNATLAPISPSKVRSRTSGGELHEEEWQEVDLLTPEDSPVIISYAETKDAGALASKEPSARYARWQSWRRLNLPSKYRLVERPPSPLSCVLKI
ncbi:uncharacterized protein VTP21DRAFT_9318 [Calcarisporiella thermophila]|uniref:uncharacterized protein n=1 Tax=Calcarisporiella thermophila TaxID=911321 RepID=UPI003743D0D4